MIGRYYETFKIDTHNGIGNYTSYLKAEAMKYLYDRVSKKDGKPFFLYWAPDSTHAPTYASPEFHSTSKRDTSYGDSIKEIDDAVGEFSFKSEI